MHCTYPIVYCLSNIGSQSLQCALVFDIFPNSDPLHAVMVCLYCLRFLAKIHLGLVKHGYLVWTLTIPELSQSNCHRERLQTYLP